jgi:hypothetical protein
LQLQRIELFQACPSSIPVFFLCELFGILHCPFFGSAGVFNMSNISTKGTNRLCLSINN